MPGVIVNVKWPMGLAAIDESMPQWDWTIGPSRYFVESADPNDHYRPWMEQHVGRQGWDWDWCMMNNDVACNRLTIKFRHGKENFASIVSLKWA